MNVLEAIKTRKTIKAYKPGAEITPEQLDLIIEAGRLAPTANNLQDNQVLILKSLASRQKYKEGFEDFNQQYMETAQAIVIFVGIPWKMEALNNGQRVYDVDVHAYDLPEEQKRQIVEFVTNYYATRSGYADVLDIYSSAIMFSYMSLEATALGFGTTPMLGIAKNKLEALLLENGEIKPGQRVNLAFAIGHEDADHPRNKAHQRIRIPKEEQFKVL